MALRFIAPTARLFPASLPRKLDVGEDDFWHFYVADEVAIRWFQRCWRAAGGARFRFRAVVGTHDAAERLDLVSGKWIRDV